MSIQIVFETHSLTEDNDRGMATGWLDGRLSERGRTLARELGERRSKDNIAAVFASDLGRAVETARLAFPAPTSVPILLDWRLRECDYGEWNGHSVAEVLSDRTRFLDEPYPRGESWREATRRVARFVDDLSLRWSGHRVLVIGHIATFRGLEQRILGTRLETQVSQPFEWREGWEFAFER